MSVTEQGPPAPSLRRLPFTIRLAPQLVNPLLAQSSEPSRPGEIGGLLFGLVEEGQVVVQAYSPFAANAHANGAADRALQDRFFEQRLSSAKKEFGIGALTLLGWYAIREGGGLVASDLAYHDWYFPRPNDLALVVKPERGGGVSLEVYCRTASGVLTADGHRVGLVRLSQGDVEAAIEIVPRPKIQDDFFMRAYELREAEEEKDSGWKESIASQYRKAFSFLRPGESNGPAKSREKAGALFEELRDLEPPKALTAEPETTQQEIVGLKPTEPAPRPNGVVRSKATPAPAEPARPVEMPKPVETPEPVQTQAPQTAPPTPIHGSKPAEVARPSTPGPTEATRSSPPVPDATSLDPVLSTSRELSTQASGMVGSTAIQQTPVSSLSIPQGASIVRGPEVTQQRTRQPWVPVLAVFLVTAVVTFAVVYSLGGLGRLPGSLQQLLSPQPVLALKVDVQGDRLLVSWNRHHPLVRHALNGTLTIEDGSQRREVPLDSLQVANGSILYHPSSDDVTFRLEVDGTDGKQTVESMRVLDGSKPAPLDLSSGGTPEPLPARRPQQQGFPQQGTSLPSSPKTRPNELTIPETSAKPSSGNRINDLDQGEPIVQPSRGGPGSDGKANTASEASARKVAGNDEVVQATPEEGPARPPSVLDRGELPAPIATGAAPTTAMPEGPGTQPASNPRVEGPAVYLPPKPVRQVLPNVSALPSGAVAQAGQLEVLVRIDSTGRVTDARVVPNGRLVNRVLVGSALMAARQWRFEPATLHGKAVSSEHSIVFQFTARP